MNDTIANRLRGTLRTHFEGAGTEELSQFVGREFVMSSDTRVEEIALIRDRTFSSTLIERMALLIRLLWLLMVLCPIDMP